MHRFIAFLTSTCLALSGLAPAVAATEDLAKAVRTRNAELAALDARVAEARARVSPAGALPDPRVEVEVMDGMTLQGPRAAIKQMLPLAGQPALMTRMAELEAQMKQAERDDRELMLLADGVKAVADLAYLTRVEGLTATMREHAAHMARVAEAKYATGKGMQADVLRAQVARTKLLGPPAAYAAKRRAVTARLAAIAPAWTPPKADLSPGSALLAPTALQEKARQASPMLRMRRLAVEEAETDLALARAERLPDVDLGVMAGKSMPGDMSYVGGMAMFTVPLWYGRKQAARVEAGERRMAAEQAALTAAERDVAARLEEAQAQVAAADRQLAIYRGGLLLQTSQTYRAALAAYQVDRTDFLMVLDALMALYDAQMAEAMAVTERRQMAAMALAIAGQDPTVERITP